MKTLILVRGLPGSGKSTLANAIVDNNAVCEADKYFIDAETGEYKFNAAELKIAHQWCRDEVEARMKQNQDTNGLDYSEIVVSNTFTQEWEMYAYYGLAEKYGYRVHSVIVENRHDGINVHGCPAEKVKEMKNRFEIEL